MITRTTHCCGIFFFFSSIWTSAFQYMIVVVFILCIILGFWLAMEIIGRKKFNEKESTFISFLYLLLNAGTNLGIALVCGGPYWPFYISKSGCGFACMMVCIDWTWWQWCERLCALSSPIILSTYYLVNRWHHCTDNQ